MPAPSIVSRLYNRLPSSISRPVRVVAVLSLVFQMTLIATGGAVRLTASGLGCPTWPTCTDDSFVNTPEMGIHGVIEFANRALTGVLVIIVIAAFLSVIRLRRERRDLFVLTLLQGLSIPLQAVIGGITVLTGLNPYIVGVHFAVSIVLVLLTTILVWRVFVGPRGDRVVPVGYLVLTHVTTLAVAVTVAVGILTTGAGPHAGDNSNPDKLAPRNGLDPALLQHVHSWPAYVTFGLTVLLVVLALALRLPRRWPVLLLLVEVAQIAVGLTQARLGLPEGLVLLHMVLAGLLVAAMTATVLAQRPPRVEVGNPLDDREPARVA
jgi:cytochrome c oxidase assembly protein subunit 15